VTTVIDRCARAGYEAARRCAQASSNPWPIETVGGLAWSFGFNVGTVVASLPAPLRWLARAWLR